MSENEALDTFEDGPYTGEETTANYEAFDDLEESDNDDDEGQDSEETSVQAKERKEIDEDSQVNLLEDQDEKREEEEEEGDAPKDEGAKKADEKPDDTKPSEDDATKDAGIDADPVRNLKAFRDGKAYEVPEDAQINVKINGKSEKVALKDLRDNYSGQVAYEEKFNTLSSEKKEFQQNREVYEQEISELTQTMSGIRELVVKAQAGEEHPLAGFNKLLDLMGINSVHYNKQMQEQLFEEYDIFSEMSDAEREAYWLQKENKYLVNKQESEHSKSAASKAQQEKSAQIQELREAHNVNEDDFNSAYADLQELGTENITAELVIQTAKLSPLMDIGEDIMSKYEDQLTTDEMDSMVREIAVTMYENPDYTVEEIKSLIAQELEVETLVTEIAAKRKAPEELKYETSSSKSKRGYESFDDWD